MREEGAEVLVIRHEVGWDLNERHRGHLCSPLVFAFPLGMMNQRVAALGKKTQEGGQPGG